MPRLTALLGQRPRLEDSRRAQPLVEPDFVHNPMIAQKYAMSEAATRVLGLPAIDL
jgi:hypothetical protein